MGTKESIVNVRLGYVVGTKMQEDVTGISLALQAREARLVLRDMYDQKMISNSEYEIGLRKVARMVGIHL